MGRTVDDYVGSLAGWQAETVRTLRGTIMAVGGLSESVKWGHPVYEADGPVCLLKAHKSHVTLGFWRGAEMRDLHDRLEPHGSFLMASIKLQGSDAIDAARVGRLVAAGVALNRLKGDPTKAV
ncbi:DUF1801 domain-containing protein [Mesorhizobium sp. LHD-90]|uniref:DUF1801 domain-containing protein n=1 Tax=Mesorhizobium sp. LHD-90 TaxID=3071414 RepID=UPI0027E01C39|nr:DUF1801 domain-containing protein [Mesorhizobium sp. LHD-90]MDQ6436956.1 DUF1801 domain-containing protein [Mesorhizobium sp. LHD-90]